MHKLLNKTDKFLKEKLFYI